MFEDIPGTYLASSDNLLILFISWYLLKAQYYPYVDFIYMVQCDSIINILEMNTSNLGGIAFHLYTRKPKQLFNFTKFAVAE